jgi:hypothetical protein
MQMTYLWMATIALFSCADNDEKSTVDENSGTVHAGATDTIVPSGELVTLEGCYEQVVLRDTAILYLNVIGSEVTGKLVYNRYEKDDNSGSLKGELKGGRIHADYVFQSEGQTSTRAVVFRIQDTLLLEGHGEEEEREGKVVFRKPDRLQYNSTHPFVKVPCRQDLR